MKISVNIESDHLCLAMAVVAVLITALQVMDIIPVWKWHTFGIAMCWLVLELHILLVNKLAKRNKEADAVH